MNQDIFLDRYAAAGETTPKQMLDRVAQAAAACESNPPKWEKAFSGILQDWQFVPAGRILSGAGNKGDKTLFNCYVLPMPKDSRGGIMTTLTQMTEIMSRGGGVGINISSLRPRDARVQGVNGASSGAVSWGGIFSSTTGLISQGGSRRGALMLVLEDWHPDILEFVNSKRDNGELTNANLSIGLSDCFMEAVEKNQPWDLVFPDTSYPDYDEVWDGNLTAWIAGSRKVIHYRTIQARELWNAICESAWACAEPGIWFSERSRKLSNSGYYNWIAGVNPCGEEPLPAWGVCNLGSLNLPKFYDSENKVNWLKLREAIQLGVRFLDNIIDITPYFYEENRQQQKEERRIGLGTMGLADLLILNKLRYGSPAAIQFTEQLYKFICVAAYTASSHLAEERDSFPQFNTTHFLTGEFARTLPEKLQGSISRWGLRNVTVLTAAPTGTTATMLDVSTGIEPHYALEYTRQTRLGTFTQRIPLLQEDTPPDYFVTSMELTPAEHIDMMAPIQRWIDAAISKTINLKAAATVEDVKATYLHLYRSGAKGGTIYRDSSRDIQVLRCADEECTI